MWADGAVGLVYFRGFKRGERKLKMKMKIMSKTLAASLAMGLLGAATGAATAATDAEIDAFMNPYAKGFPSAPGVKEGVLVDKNNADQFKSVLLPRIYDQIKAGNTSFTIGKQLSAPPPAVLSPHPRSQPKPPRLNLARAVFPAIKGGCLSLTSLR